MQPSSDFPAGRGCLRTVRNGRVPGPARSPNVFAVAARDAALGAIVSDSGPSDFDCLGFAPGQESPFLLSGRALTPERNRR
jgi:hypothetical protein